VGARSPKLEIVAAVAENGVIGRAGSLPWRLKSELEHFRNVTMGKPVVMGRRTYLSIGRPLKGRTNIVVTSDRTFAATGVLAAPSLEAALTVARGDALRRCADAVAIVGGAQIYARAIVLADRMVITRVHLSPEGDAKFPAIDSTTWLEIARRDHQPGPQDEAAFTTLVYDRIGASAGDANQPP
jgi:dihydrofolate reductase